MAKITSIKNQILAVAKVAKKRYEKPDDFVRRVIRAVNQLTDEDWALLPDSAQVWANEAIIAYHSDNSITAFPGEEEEMASVTAPPVVEIPVEVVAPAPASAVQFKPQAPTFVGPPEPYIGPAIADKIKPKIGGGRRFDELCVLHPTMNWLEVLALLEDEGYRISANTATVRFYETWRFLQTLDKMGMLKQAWPKELPKSPGLKLAEEPVKP